MEDNKQPSGNYPEDYHLENGNYEHLCVKCGSRFFGLNHRRYCKCCTSVPPVPDKMSSAATFLNDSKDGEGIKLRIDEWLQIHSWMESYAQLREGRAVEKDREKIKKMAQRMSNGVDVVLLSDIENL